MSDCIFEIHQLWQSSFSKVYSNSCCSCSFEHEIIKIGQPSHKMYSNHILNFQESTSILNAHTKKTYCMHFIYANSLHFYIVWLTLNLREGYLYTKIRNQNQSESALLFLLWLQIETLFWKKKNMNIIWYINELKTLLNQIKDYEKCHYLLWDLQFHNFFYYYFSIHLDTRLMRVKLLSFHKMEKKEGQLFVLIKYCTIHVKIHP